MTKHILVLTPQILRRLFRSCRALVAAVLVSSCGGGASTVSTSQPISPPPPPPVPISIDVADGNVTEGNAGTANLSFEVSLSATSGSAATVDYATSDGTASSVDDYVAGSGTLTFDAGTTLQNVAIIINGDGDNEANETVSLSLSNPTNAILGRSIAIGTIIDDDGAILSGLDQRPDNRTCIAPARPTGNASVTVVDAFPNLPNIGQPTKMLLEPVVNPRWFVLQKTGELVTFDPDVANAINPFLDLSGVVRTASEGGLLGLAFHPDYPATPEIFLSYTINHTGPDMRSVVSRFILDNVVSPGAGTVEEVILEVDQDFDNHNGGDIAFGRDQYLYIGLGDGGSGGDPNNRAQDTTRLLGSMLRIDVLGANVSFPGNPYGIPGDNPFVGNVECGPGLNSSNCPEIYAWGLRNPWRWTFDSDTGELWLADVGQGAREEVNLIELGGNYGWRCREGANDFNTKGCGVGLIDPVTEYTRSDGNSITGGSIYRGSAIPELIGKYIFADYGSGRFWALQTDGQGGYTNDELIDTNFGPTSFAADDAGELYFTDINSGRLRKIEPAGGGTPDTVPNLLSNSGCTDPSNVNQAYSGLVPYSINAEFWSDGAVKERFIGMPNGTTITRGQDDEWNFPNGTVIVKNFRLQGNLVETRHLMRHPDGVWAGYTYEWNTQQTEATRVRGGKSQDVGGQDWIFPSEGQCMECHTSGAGFSLGMTTGQMNRPHSYPVTQRTANQLETLNDVMMFTNPLPDPASSLPVLTNPEDAGANDAARARAYLHTNCAGCHHPGGPTPSTMDLRSTTPLASTSACDAVPLVGDLGVANARLIAVGDAARSLIVERASRRDSHGMPPVGSNIVDINGLAVVSNWIDGLVNCN